MRRLLLVAIPSAGCLSTPSPRAVDGGPVDAMPCDHDPRPAERCADRAQLPDDPFPNDATFDLRAMVVDDLDNDGRDDLVVIDLDGQEIYILLGPIDPGVPRYQARFTTGIDVGGIDVQQVAGTSPCPDLTVFGKIGTDPGSVQLWEATGAPDVMFTGPPRVRFVDFSPQVFDGGGAGLPVMVAWARLHSTDQDLLVSDVNTMRLLHVHGDLAGFEDVDIDPVMHIAPATAFWDSIEAIHVVPTAGCETDGVVVAEGLHAHVLEGTAPIAGGPQVDTMARTRGGRAAELSGGVPTDLVVSGAEEIGAYLIEHAGDDRVQIAADPPWRALDYQVLGPDFVLDAFDVGHLGAPNSGAPDFVAADHGDPAPRILLIENFDVEGDEPQNARIYDGLPVGFVPRDVVIADLYDGNGAGEAEIVVMSADGQIVCLLPNPISGQLEPCS